MNCDHVRGLIDAGRFAGYSRTHLAAAREHAEGCPTCGPALAAATALTSDLANLPRPLPPPDLSRAILARIARSEAAHANDVAVMAERPAAVSVDDWPAWLTAVGALAAALAIALSMPGAMTVDLFTPRIGSMAGSAFAAPTNAMGALLLAAGLVLYLTGLFSPVSRPKRP